MRGAREEGGSLRFAFLPFPSLSNACHAGYIFFRLLLFFKGYLAGASAEERDSKLYYLFLLAKKTEEG